MTLTEVTHKQTEKLSDVDDLIAAALVYARIADDMEQRAGDQIKAVTEWRVVMQDIYGRMVEQNLQANAWANQSLRSA